MGVLKLTCLIESPLDGEPITCKPRYRKPIAYSPFCTLIFTFNELPPVLKDSIPDSRIQLVPWTNRFKHGDPEIVGPPYELAERSGLFNRLVPVMRRLLLGADADENA